MYRYIHIFNILQSLLCKIKVLFYFSCLFVRFLPPDNYARNSYLYLLFNYVLFTIYLLFSYVLFTMHYELCTMNYATLQDLQTGGGSVALCANQIQPARVRILQTPPEGQGSGERSQRGGQSSSCKRRFILNTTSDYQRLSVF